MVISRFSKPVKKTETLIERAKRYQASAKAKRLARKAVVGKKRAKKVRLPSIKKLEKKLKDVMYPYIKRRDGPVCISCGKKNLLGRDWQAGHYIKAELCNMVTRYDEWNINSQCATCNLWKRGNTIAYRLAMLDKYGERVVNTLDREYKSPLPLNFNSRVWLLEQIKLYENK